MIKPDLLVPQINTVGLVAYYKLWAGLTTTGKVFDYSLNGNGGTVTGAVPAYPGFSFDAVDDEINCGSDSSIDDIFVGGGTSSIWLLSSGRGENNIGTVLAKAVWFFRMTADTTTMLFRQAFAAAEQGQHTVAITANIWQHIVIVYDSDLAANNPVVYINGISVSVSRSGGIPANDNAGTDATAPLVIGDIAGSAASWDGKIGEVMLFGTEKTAAEAKSIFEVTRWRYGV